MAVSRFISGIEHVLYSVSMVTQGLPKSKTHRAALAGPVTVNKDQATSFIHYHGFYVLIYYKTQATF